MLEGIYLLAKKKNPEYIKWQGWEPTHKKYQANIKAQEYRPQKYITIRTSLIH